MRNRKWWLFLFVSLFVLIGCPNGTAVLSSVVPSLITAGSPDVVLSLTGKNFTNQAVVVWNGKEMGQLSTSFVDSQHLTALVPASFVATVGTASVMALQAGQNQSATQPLTITIGNVAPILTGIAPAHVIVGAPVFTLTLTGTNFNASSVINWNSTALATTLVSPTQLTASVAQSNYTAAGVQKVTVVNGGTGGGTSTAVNFTVVAPLTVTTTTLPSGSIGTAYTATLLSAGGTAPYTWSVTAGTLPAGLTLNSSTGVISGTPTAAGSSSLTVQVVDSTGALARKRF